jgi:hypothetical protein
MLDKLDGVRALEEVGVDLRGELLSMNDEVVSVLSLSLLLLTDLGKLVVGDKQVSIIDLASVERSASNSSSIRSLEADESAWARLWDTRSIVLAGLDDLD